MGSVLAFFFFYCSRSEMFPRSSRTQHYHHAAACDTRCAQGTPSAGWSRAWGGFWADPRPARAPRDLHLARPVLQQTSSSYCLINSSSVPHHSSPLCEGAGTRRGAQPGGGHCYTAVLAGFTHGSLLPSLQSPGWSTWGNSWEQRYPSPRGLWAGDAGCPKADECHFLHHRAVPPRCTHRPPPIHTVPLKLSAAN